MKILLSIILIPVISMAADYDRATWRHWVDADRDCQDTRQEVLIRDSLIPVTFKTDRNCKVESGLWLGSYTGNIYTSPSDLHIDHVVTLKYAHAHGGENWPRLLKEIFANDLDNLRAVDKRENMSKGSKSPLDYMPLVLKAHDDYLTQWFIIRKKYRLK